MLSNLDIKKANEMYDFLIKDMEDLPSVEPASKSFIERFGTQANGVLDWVRQNQDVLSQGFELIKGFMGKKQIVPGDPLPPINE